MMLSRVVRRSWLMETERGTSPWTTRGGKLVDFDGTLGFLGEGPLAGLVPVISEELVYTEDDVEYTRLWLVE